MTFLTLQQLITVADAVLQPPEDVFADASGTPSDDLERQSAAKFHSLAVSAFTTLCSYLADLPASQPQAQPIAEQASPLIQELTAAEAAAHETAVHQQKLILKSCQAALLYAKDDGLLTPWSSHQLHLASSSLLNALSPSQHAAIGKTSHSCTSVSHNVQQDLLIYLLPALLPVTSAGSQAKDSYDDIDFNADQGLYMVRIMPL